jgi:hypothetical protein
MPELMKPYAGMHPRALASIAPKDRPKQDAPKIDTQAPSLKSMREQIVKKRPADKEVALYFQEVVERLVDAREREDDGES